METKEDRSSVRESESYRRPKTSEVNRNSEASMETVEVEEIVNENEQLSKDLSNIDF